VETVITHEIEAEIAAPPPRRNAGLTPGTRALLALAGILALLLFLGGARALEESARLAWVGLTGRPATARVTEIAPGAAGFRYEYVDPFTGHAQRCYARLEPLPPTVGDAAPGLGGPASAAPAPRLFLGEHLALRVAGEGPRSIVYFWTPAPWAKGLFLALCGLVVMGVSLSLAVALARWRRLRVRLLRAGRAVVGTIIHKHTDVHDTPRYYLRYGYMTADTREACEREERVSAEQWKRFEVGQPVTVLYDPERLLQAGLYALMRQ
jgi:hypothetical protein